MPPLRRIPQPPSPAAGAITALIVDQDPVAAGRVRASLQALHARCVESADPWTAWSALGSQHFDIVFIDPALGVHDGLAVLRHLRAADGLVLPDPKTAVVAVSRFADVHSRVRALNAGADRFLAKPFASEELNAMTRAVLRRPAATGMPLVCGELSLDLPHRTCTVAGEHVGFSHLELQLLAILVRAYPEVVPKDALRPEHASPPFTNRALQVHIHNLRRKLGAASIQTVYGMGYRWRGLAHDDPRVRSRSDAGCPT